MFYIMDDNLKLFENPDFGDVRVLLDEKHEPWFVGNDVAKCLGYADPRDAVRRLVDDEDCKMLRLSEDREAYDSTPIHNQYVNQIRIFSLNDKFHFFCYLGFSFCLFVRIGKMICTFSE